MGQLGLPRREIGGRRGARHRAGSYSQKVSPDCLSDPENSSGELCVCTETPQSPHQGVGPPLRWEDGSSSQAWKLSPEKSGGPPVSLGGIGALSLSLLLHTSDIDALLVGILETEKSHVQSSAHPGSGRAWYSDTPESLALPVGTRERSSKAPELGSASEKPGPSSS